MHSTEDIKGVYEQSKYYLTKISKKDVNCEKNLIHIIKDLSLEENLSLFDSNEYDLDKLSTIFRNYEEKLKAVFEDKEIFPIYFKSYVLLIETFTSFCICISTKKQKKENIRNIMEVIKESINMIKFFIALEESQINILNNLIGKQLYWLTHIRYVNISSKEIDYILDEYFLYLEKMHHGFDLSSSTNFANCDKTNIFEEKMVLLNNSSFLLLKMFYKLQHFKEELDYDTHPNFIKLQELFYEIAEIPKTDEHNLDTFKSYVFEKFFQTGEYLKNELNYNIIDEKINLLLLNTDEYKQLVDIIQDSK